MSNLRFEQGRALVIGIGPSYTGLRPLPAVVRADAVVLEQVLTNPTICGYPKEHVQLLLDAEATKENIVAGLKKLAAEAQVDDTVFVFFSGHGATRYDAVDAGTYLCPVDFDSSGPRATGIEASELSTLIGSIPSERVVVVLDACHSEGAVFFKTADESKGLMPGIRTASLELLAEGKGRVVVSSCREEETSLTYSEKGHSLFTYFLLQGLRGEAIGKDNRFVTVFDLFEYLAEEVPKCHPRPDHTQHPVIKLHAENNFAIALRHRGGWKSETQADSGIASSVATRTTETARAYARQLEDAMVTLYPTGPMHSDIWERAGGDVAQLKLSGNGRSMWSSAIRLLSLGGGGAISVEALLVVAREDFSNSELLRAL